MSATLRDLCLHFVYFFRIIHSKSYNLAYEHVTILKLTAKSAEAVEYADSISAKR